MASPRYSNVYPNAGWAFSVAAAPAVSAGAYLAGDIIGGLMTFDLVSEANDRLVLLQEIQVILKSNVTPSLMLVLFNADPTATTKDDNAAYALNVADVFKVARTFDIVALGGLWNNHNTAKSLSLGGLGAAIAPVAGTRKLFGLLVTLSAVTLGSVSDMQTRLSGIGA